MIIKPGPSGFGFFVVTKKSTQMDRSLLIIFENLFKPRQLRLAVDMDTDFVSSIHNLKTVF